MALTLSDDRNSQWFKIEMSLKLSNILMVDLFLSNKRIAVFLEQKKSKTKANT